jgi:hypothetical protein
MSRRAPTLVRPELAPTLGSAYPRERVASTLYPRNLASRARGKRSLVTALARPLLHPQPPKWYSYSPSLALVVSRSADTSPPAWLPGLQPHRESALQRCFIAGCTALSSVISSRACSRSSTILLAFSLSRLACAQLRPSLVSFNICNTRRDVVVAQGEPLG